MASASPAPEGAVGTTTRVVGVRFRPTSRIHYYDPAGFELKTGQWVIVETAKGIECGRVVIAPRQVAIAELGGSEPLKPVKRVATEDDLRQMLEYKTREKAALRRCAERVESHSLPMKLVEAEYTFDGARLTFYFAAEERVDFRALVRDLASQFHTRIELRQIGARDHAKLLGGVGMCGKTLCCSSWLTEFNVVSGLCGRLLCCLAYENDDYIAAKAEMPDYNEIVNTASGLGRVVGVNVPRESVEVMLQSGATITVPVREIEGYERQPEPPQRPGAGGCGKPNCRHGRHHSAPGAPGASAPPADHSELN
jgi:cell fate regulator YaaT (PSP1 superfamily)